jgi:predicted secreted protein
MATQAFAAFTGKVYVSLDGGSNYTAIGEVRDATLSISQEEIEASSFDSGGWKEFIPGMKEWEFESEALYLYGDAGQDNVYNVLVNGTTAKWRFIPKTGTGNKGYQGDGFVTSWETNSAVDDAVSVSISLRGSGQLNTYTAT